MQISIYQDESEYHLNEDLELVCSHVQYEVEPPCCNGRDCGCYGLYSVTCYNHDCTGMSQTEVDDMIDSYCENQQDSIFDDYHNFAEAY